MAYQAVDEIMARCGRDGVEFGKPFSLKDREENGISERRVLESDDTYVELYERECCSI